MKTTPLNLTLKAFAIIQQKPFIGIFVGFTLFIE